MPSNPVNNAGLGEVARLLPERMPIGDCAPLPEGAATIGYSREGRPLHGLSIGAGPHSVSVIAGCHADEPAGPMTARMLPGLLETHASGLLDRFTFHIVPNMNPDGAARNQIWFNDPPDFRTYEENCYRELPGDDVEFGFGDDEGTRPECRAAMAFLRPGAPYAAHFSLHGMAFADGAWFLICREWRDRSAPVRAALEATCARLNMPLFDIDRKGEKGFTRIAPGFCMTPTSTAMREHFLAQDDTEMAGRFRPSSMEFIASLGGDPLCMVSEIPLFRVDAQPCTLVDPASSRFRAALEAARASSAAVPHAELAEQFQLWPVPFDTQTRLQFAMILSALNGLEAL